MASVIVNMDLAKLTIKTESISASPPAPVISAPIGASFNVIPLNLTPKK